MPSTPGGEGLFGPNLFSGQDVLLQFGGLYIITLVVIYYLLALYGNKSG